MSACKRKPCPDHTVCPGEMEAARADAFEEAANIADPANNPRRWRVDIAQDFRDKAKALRERAGGGA